MNSANKIYYEVNHEYDRTLKDGTTAKSRKTDAVKRDKDEAMTISKKVKAEFGNARIETLESIGGFASTVLKEEDI